MPEPPDAQAATRTRVSRRSTRSERQLTGAQEGCERPSTADGAHPARGAAVAAMPPSEPRARSTAMSRLNASFVLVAGHLAGGRRRRSPPLPRGGEPVEALSPTTSRRHAAGVPRALVTARAQSVQRFRTTRAPACTRTTRTRWRSERLAERTSLARRDDHPKSGFAAQVKSKAWTTFIRCRTSRRLDHGGCWCRA